MGHIPGHRKAWPAAGEEVHSGRRHNLIKRIILHTFHRKRIYTEEKAKVVAAVWGTELIHFLAAQQILRQDDFKK